jgi:hypothetical protein
MKRDENDVALSLWAVTCDALARGEQIFLLAPGEIGEIRDLEHEEFWLLPDWQRHDMQALTEPYQDRMRALEDLRHRDDRARLKYYATVEYVDAFTSHHDLRGLDGDHTLKSSSVVDLFGQSRTGGGPGGQEGALSLVVLRVWARPEASVVGRNDLEPGDRAVDLVGREITPSGPGADGADDGLTAVADGLPRRLDRRWVRLPEPVSTVEMDPVVDDERFVTLKARLLQRTGAIRAV